MTQKTSDEAAGVRERPWPKLLTRPTVPMPGRQRASCDRKFTAMPSSRATSRVKGRMCWLHKDRGEMIIYASSVTLVLGVQTHSRQVPGSGSKSGAWR